MLPVACHGVAVQVPQASMHSRPAAGRSIPLARLFLFRRFCRLGGLLVVLASAGWGHEIFTPPPPAGKSCSVLRFRVRCVREYPPNRALAPEMCSDVATAVAVLGAVFVMLGVPVGVPIGVPVGILSSVPVWCPTRLREALLAEAPYHRKGGRTRIHVCVCVCPSVPRIHPHMPKSPKPNP
jgi:hypothetical protein